MAPELLPIISGESASPERTLDKDMSRDDIPQVSQMTFTGHHVSQVCLNSEHMQAHRTYIMHVSHTCVYPRHPRTDSGRQPARQRTGPTLEAQHPHSRGDSTPGLVVAWPAFCSSRRGPSLPAHREPSEPQAFAVGVTGPGRRPGSRWELLTQSG